jgi:hypothetical protein
LRLATKKGAAKGENIVQDTVKEVDMNGISRVLLNRTTIPMPIAATSPSNLFLSLKQANSRLLLRKIAFKIVGYPLRILHMALSHVHLTFEAALKAMHTGAVVSNM